MVSKINLWAWFEWGLLLAGLALFSITEVYHSFVVAGFGLVLISFCLRGGHSRAWLPHTGVEIPGAVFLVSAVVSTWIAYDQRLAFLQLARFVGAAALFCAVAESSVKAKRLLAFALLVMAAGLALYWPLQPGSSTGLLKSDLLTVLGLHLPGALTVFIHANIAAGTLAVSLPLGLALGWTEWQWRHFFHAGICGLLSLVVAFCLLLTGSRGAWLALAATGAIAVLVVIQRRWMSSKRLRIWFWIASAVLILSILAGLSVTGWITRLAGSVPGPTGTVQSRLEVWKQAFSLVRDYVFTGAGLMTFPMLYSNYALLINVPFLAHAHNTYLEVWIEQGMLGELALIMAIGVVIGWAWRAFDRRDTDLVQADLVQADLVQIAALAGLAVAILYGLVDVTFYLNRTLPVLGLVLGLAWSPQLGPNQSLSISAQGWRRSKEKILRHTWASWGGIVLLGLAIVEIFLVRKPLLSAWYANLGALAQTRQELSIYQPNLFAQMSIDQVRQAADLSQAKYDFQQALDFGSVNVTALQRLAQISLSYGEYQQARNWMQTAWEAGNRDDVTRLLYGDSLVACGEVQPAAEIVRGVGRAEGRLMEQAWYRYWNSKDYLRASWAWKTVLILDPDNANAARNAANAAKRLQ